MCLTLIPRASRILGTDRFPPGDHSVPSRKGFLPLPTGCILRVPMAIDESELKWAEFKQRLIEASADTDHAWLDEGEIRIMLHDACARGIPTEVILACQSACNSQRAFVDHLSGVVGKRRRRILAVDDEVEFLELLDLNFRRKGNYEVRTETDPMRAVDTINEFQPDLCIVDLKMPGMDGAQLINKIREKSQIKNVPVIILTALLEDTTVDAVTKDNVLHLSKPASWKKLFYCVEAHLDSATDTGSNLATIDV